MGLKILKDADGNPRTTWYGRISVKGKKKESNLGVPIEGRIPTDASGRIKLSAKGDAAFERSRRAAQKAFRKWRTEAGKDPADLQRKAYKARTNTDLEGLPLAFLYKRWIGIKRERKPTEGWKDMMKTWFERFAEFASKEAKRHHARCETVNDITPEIAGAWFDDIKKNYSWETVTKMMILMRGAYRRYSTSGLANPFDDIIVRGGGTGKNRKVSRKPLETKHLERLFEIAREDDFIYPLVVCAACTGMRIGDVCNLKWADVDLRKGLIECVTAKAGVRVWIPILGRLMDILKEREVLPGNGVKPSPYVFPLAAAKYNPHPKTGKDGKPMKDRHGKPILTDGAYAIYRAAQPYFARAVFGDVPEVESVKVGADGKAIPPPALADVIDKAGFTEAKRARVLDVYNRFMKGERPIDIAASIGVARSQVCMDLRDAEKLTGAPCRPWTLAARKRKTKLDLIERTRIKRDIGKRAASVYGWHSLRHTFVILALDAGVPVEKVRQIVGHGEAETTIANYYNPTKEQEAERVRQQMRGTVLDGRLNRGRALDRRKSAASALTPVGPMSVDAFIAGLSEAQRKELARKLLGL